MRYSSVFLACCALWVSAQAQQPASPTQIDKALELLRQTPTVPPAPVAQPGVALKIVTPSKPATVTYNVPATNQLSGSDEEKARELLRKMMVTPEVAVPPQTTPTAQPAPQVVQKPAAPVRTPAPRSNWVAAASAPPSTNALAAETEDKARAVLRKYTTPVQAVTPATTTTQTPQIAVALTPTPAPQIASPQVPMPQAPIAQSPVAQTPAAAPTTVAPTQTEDPQVRAKNREAVRQKALSDARKIAEQQRATERQSPEMAAEQQRRATADLERQRELQRIEMEVDKARQQRELKAKTDVAQPAVTQPVPTPTPIAPTPAAAPQAIQPAPIVVQPTPAAPVIQPPAAQRNVVQTPAPQTAVVQTPAAQPVPAAQPAQPQQTVPVPRGTSTKFPGLAPDMEQRAREILNQIVATTENAPFPTLATKSGAGTSTQTPAAQPAPTVAATTAPNTASTPAATTTTAATLPPDKEAQARELLQQTLSSLPTQPAPQAAKSAPEQPKVEAPRVATNPGATAAPSPSVAASGPPKGGTPNQPAASVAPAAELPAQTEIQARQLLEQTLSSLPVQPTPEDPKAKREAEKQAREQAKREVQMKADAEVKARKEVLRLEEESRQRAREEARKRIEAEKRNGQGASSSAAVAQQETTSPVQASKSAATEPVKIQRAVATPPTAKEPAKKTGSSRRDAKPTPYADNPSASKEQRLADLLDAYKRDEINAEQYHAQRKKILSE